MGTVDHAHIWGPIERSRIAGTVHRKCQLDGCTTITLDVDDEEADADTTANNVPNLDCMSSHEELSKFWYKHQRGRAARELFPEGGKGTRRAAGNLASYASNKAAAMDCRLRGNIQAALMYEGICERIYGDLPEFARW